MDISAFQNLFPAKNDIKPDYLFQPIHQKEYLINGEIRLWTGEKRDVYSPVCIKENNSAEQVLIGSYPILNFDEAIQGVDGAVAAHRRRQDRA